MGSGDRSIERLRCRVRQAFGRTQGESGVGRATHGTAAYAASKGYVLLFGEALHAELQPFNVSVTVLSPGATATSFGAVAGQKNTTALRMLMMEPLPVATTGILAMLRRKKSVVAGILNKLVVFSNRLMPRPLQSLVMRKVMSG